jgi:SAM-dependent methyltransferase
MAASEQTEGRIEQELEQIYAHRFTASERAKKARVWKTICDHFLARYIRPEATVLDIGAGYCEFVNHVRAERKIAVDLNPDTPRAAAPDVVVLTLPLEGLADALEPESVDLVFASNVFEHMRSVDALLGILESLRGVLKPGGLILIMQPNIRLLGGRFWDFVDHTLPLTELGMSEALELIGFDIVECRARFLPYTFKSRLPAWPWLVRLYLKLPPAQWLFGKQMFLVASRPT